MYLPLSSRLNALIDMCRTQGPRPAIVAQNQTLTFAGLGRRVQAIYDAMQGRTQAPLLIHGHKELDVIPAMIAATYAGCGFVFADISYPLGRIMQIVETCGCDFVLRTDPAAPDVPLPTIDTTALPDRPLRTLKLIPEDEGRLFYVTFTSGSTGTPKGIPTTRDSFAAFQDWFEPLNTRSAGGGNAHVNHASMAFDMSMSDLWTALFAGRTVYLLDHANTLNPRANLKQLQSCPEAPVGTLTATPAFFAVMLEDPRFAATALPRLRSFWIGGELVQKSLLKRLRDRFPGCEIHHAYGPSEASCITHSCQLTDADLDQPGPLPLGAEQTGCAVMVSTDEGLAQTGDGEIVLVGPQVATGYLPKDHPNNAKFGQIAGQRCYYTGDHGTVSDTGNMVIHGRIDTQVKVNGFRIELGEIERCAAQVEGIRQAVALQAAQGAETRGLILVLNGEDLASEHVAQVRAHLASRLPPYMVPARILVEDKLPLSLAGKIDRKAMHERFGMT